MTRHADSAYFDLWKLLGPIIRPKIRVADIGAAQIDEPPPYLQMLKDEMVSVLAVDPQDDLVRNGFTYLDSRVVGSGEDRTFRTYAAKGMSSFLLPDKAACRAFAKFGQFSNIIKETTVPTVTLDNLTDDVDWLKMDCQGAELEIMTHAPRIMKTISVVHLEVPFVPLYAGQPSFGEIDLFMRENGFLPHTFAHIKKWLLTPLVHSPRPPSQLLEADIVYVRNFLDMTKMQERHLFSLALIAHYGYQSTDLVARCLQEIVRRGAPKTSMLQDYVKTL